MVEYQKRVDTFLRLSATKVIGLEDLDAENEGLAPQEYEANRLTTGCNVLLYGVPGSGKSWTIEHEYCKPGCVVERLVFPLTILILISLDRFFRRLQRMDR